MADDRPDRAPDSRDALEAIAESIADGRRVDWDSAFALTPSLGAELRDLAKLERIRGAHHRAAEEFAGGPAAVLAGTILSHYRVDKLIGAGGMGVVYKAHDRTLERDVALKVLHPGRLEPEGMRDRLMREARMAAAITHPNVATIYEVGEDQGHVFLAMEWVDGLPLSDLARGKPLEPKVVLEIGAQIAAALEAAHDAGVLHRDLKPANICVTRVGVVKVLDFGVATRLMREEPAPPDGVADTETRSWSETALASDTAGTLAYMAPEIVRGEAPGIRSDLWSLGASLHEALAGERPFGGATIGELRAAIVKGEPRELPESVPPPLRKVVRRCLNRNPEQRYGRASDVREALASAAGGVKRPAAFWPAAVALGLTALGVAALLYVAMGGPGVPRQPSVAVIPTRNSLPVERKFVADGLTDELIDALAGISRLRVLSRTTTDAIAKSEVEPRTLARKYGFAYLLETAATPAGSAVRISARLVDAQSDRAVWSATFVRPLDRVATVDQEIALRVARHLNVHLSEEESARLHIAAPVDPAAFAALVRGRALAMTRNYRPALDQFREAVRIDSNYASAHAAIADCYSEMLYYHLAPPAEALPGSIAAADRALALDSTQADAHLARVFLHGLRWDWEGARQELIRAEADAPGNPQVYYRWSLYRGVMNDGAASVAAMQEAVRLDPASPRLAVELGLAYLNARRVDRAALEFERVMAWDTGPEAARARAYRGRCYALEGRADSAIAALTSPGHDHDVDPIRMEELAYAYAAAGRAADARRVVATLDGIDPTLLSPLTRAAVDLALGSKTGALATLERACAAHDTRVVWLATDMRFDSIRRERRYVALLEAMGLRKGAGATLRA